ncbi:hypothetical protein [Nostoc sp. C117]|uniref:hypothetical protein n=1 Tax=Nostoc sp. C117 TaxID=3349875 RepID=UPI00370D383F
MSSGSSGRYQSKLFNFVHQQSRRLTEQLEHTFRHLQVATKWGVELLLYPVYLLFHSSESDGKTLHTKEPQSRLNLPSNDTDFQPTTHLSVDTPIENVLETVYYLSSEEEISPTGYAYATPEKNSQTSNTNSLLGVVWRNPVYDKSKNNADIIHSSKVTEDNPVVNIKPSQRENTLKQYLRVVRGIATNLLNRNLVLVTDDNEILDILTPEQQTKLENRIISEVANYWQSWRLAEAKKETELLPQIDRLLAKLTEDNPIKIPALAKGISQDLLDSNRLLTFIDVAIAKLESNALIPVKESSQEIVEVAQTQLNIFIYGKEQLISQGKIAVSNDDLQTRTLNIQALIEAAINYFFGVSGKKTLESTTSDESSGKVLSHHSRKALSKSHEFQNQDLTDDPWLTWSDLFGDTDTLADKPITLSENTTPALASNLSAGLSWPQNWTLQQPKGESSLVQRKKTTRNLTLIPKTSAKVASFKQTEASISQSKNENRKGEILQQQFRQSTEVEAQPNWIETKATAIGYDKHLLEQLLEWLDYVMLWLEEICVKVFQSFQRVWQGK